jgi:YVTN family beta-propeller protein
VGLDAVKIARASLILVGSALVLGACVRAAADPAVTTLTSLQPLDTSTTFMALEPTTSTTTSTTSSTTSTTTSTTTTSTLPPTTGRTLELVETIGGDISPKSVVASGTGLFFAQNMMYRHTVTVYNAAFELVHTISDTVTLSDFGFDQYEGDFRGAPVEAAFTSDGTYAYVSNYEMSGAGFNRPGTDGCNESNWDTSFLYRIDTASLEVDQVIAVGAVPKFLAVTPDDKYVLVTNWCSFDMSIVDIESAQVVATIRLGRHPRGIAVSADATTAYATVMGGRDIAVIDLDGFAVDWIRGIGTSPRHIVLDPNGRYLYATLNGEGRVAKVDLITRKVVARVATGSAPRSMAISTDGASLYIVNYNSDTVSKVLTETMTEIQEIRSNDKPIGITYDPLTGNVWVSNYSGTITVYADAVGNE